ncbi:MAG: protein kinase [Culturomica sp.]|nr:protein kinase [Culturomica sp.]
MSNDSEKTVRPDAEPEPEKTVRPDAEPEPGKTMRPAEPVEKTMRPAAASADKTMRPDAEKTMRPDTGKTMRPDQQEETTKIVNQQFTDIEINKVRYEVVKTISEGTGEAQIFLVESQGRRFALKLYYVGIFPPPNHDIMEIIKKSAGTGLLVATLEHGIWTNPQTQEKRDYELMEFCAGGSLDQLKINGDEKLLSEIALRCAAALDFLHKQQVIHRDVKPANFFFRKESRELADLALADFGISIQADKNGKLTISADMHSKQQLRTPIYTAPEYYDFSNVIDGKIQISNKMDFFSLGMMLLTLWDGEEIFRMSEYELNSLKKSGKLPYPKNMGERTLQLIKALTLADPNTRADLEKIARWAKGETIYDLQAEKDNIAGFKIVFNSSKNQIAHSPKELVQFMGEDKTLAIKYLYQGKIEEWLEGIHRNELAAELHEITEKRFPKNEEAGFFATCYFLDDELPYTDVKGNPLNSPQEIAQSLKANAKQYEKALANSEDPLFLFFSARGSANVTQEFAPLFKKSKDNRSALLQLIHTLDQTLPWIMVTDQNESIECHTPEEVLEAKYKHTLSDESWADLISEGFLTWLRYTDPAVEGKVRSAKGHTERQTAVLYNLSPKVSYTFQMDENAGDYFFTAEEVGNYMNLRMREYILDENDNFASFQLDTMCNIDDTQLYDYFKSKGVYDDKIDWIKYCSDLKSKENAEKPAPYNWKVGVYKAIKGLGFDPFYYFPKSDKRVYTLDELNGIPSKEINDELAKGYLQAWLTTFWQEDPALDLQKEHTFEKETIKYLRYLGKLDKENIDVKNYNIGKKSVEKALSNLKRKQRTHVWSKIVIGSITLLASVAIILSLLNINIPINAEDHKGWIAIAAGVAGVLTVGIMFLGANAGCLINLVVGAVVYFAVGALLLFCIPYIGFIAAGLLVLMLIFWVIRSYLKYPALNRANKHLLHPGFEELELEPLHFAFSDEQTFQSSIGDASYNYASYLSTGTKRFYKQLVFPWMLIIGLGALLYWASSKKAAWQAEAEIARTLEGEWQGTFEERPATFSVTKATAQEVRARISVKYNSQTTETVKGTVDMDTKTFHFDDGNPGNNILDGAYQGSFNEGFTGFTGTYENYKTKKQVAFTFTKSVSPGQEKTEAATGTTAAAGTATGTEAKTSAASQSAVKEPSQPVASGVIGTGTWSVTASNGWTADFVVQSVNSNGTFKGYFDWSKSGNYSGREHCEGSYNKTTKAVIMKGIRLENANGISLSAYRATLSEDGRKMTKGTKSTGGTWEAVRKN